MGTAPDDVEVINVSGRALLGALPAVGLVLAVGFPPLAFAADESRYRGDPMSHCWVDDPLMFVAIATGGTVTITCHRQETWQGAHTRLPLVVADELEADWSRVQVRQAQAEEVRFGTEDTGDSRSTRHFLEAMRRCGAAARTMLELAAAWQWKVPAAEVAASHHEVVHRPTNRRLGYGALSIAASLLPVPARGTLRLKAPGK